MASCTVGSRGKPSLLSGWMPASNHVPYSKHVLCQGVTFDGLGDHTCQQLHPRDVDLMHHVERE